MAHVPRSRRSMVLALLASTAATSLLGACGQTPKLFSQDSQPAEVKMSEAEAANATSQWARAYLRSPQDPQMALGYARSLKAIGAKDQSLEVLKAAYRVNPNNGEVAAELGRVALEMNRVDIASTALESAEAQGIDDWKTLSAQGTLYAKKGDHEAAQKYFLAALQKKPDSSAVINNLALSYALDGKAKEAEELLRKAVANGQGDDKRIRQNLAMVLGLQGKFSEARQVASVDMTEEQAKASVSYLRNMLASPTQVAAAEPQAPRKPQPSAADWSPFGYSDSEEETAPAKAPTAPEAIPVAMAANDLPSPDHPKVQVVKPVDEIEAPAASKAGKAAQKTGVATQAPATPKVAQVTAAPAPRAEIIRVPETQTAAADTAPANTAVAQAAMVATPTSTVAKTTRAQSATTPATAEIAQAEMVIPITPPPATTSAKSAGIAKQQTTIVKADLR